MDSSGTIAAISSPPTPSPRIILRLGGPEAFRITQSLANTQPRPGASQVQLRFHDLRIPAWLYVFRAPRSYTGDDLVEFHIPGNPLLARMLLDELYDRGARPAEPGEFTARAYFNGRLDLTEAEGVAATIAAHSEAELSAARQLLAGELARRLKPAIDLLATTLALVEVGIDFSEEDVTFLPDDDARRRIASINATLADLINNSARFEALTHEPTIVLIGRPNAGKSTLLNTLAGRARAIVSPIAGTTRDALTAEVPLTRGLVRITDVAGLDHFPQNAIEIQMQQRAQSALEAADIVVLVQDIADAAPPPPLARQPHLTVHTKLDLQQDPPTPSSDVIQISAQTGQNLPDLRNRLDQLCFGQPSGASLALNARHLKAISTAQSALTRAHDLAQPTPEILALELREALDALGQITGNISPEDLLGRIFSAFCIGK